MFATRKMWLERSDCPAASLRTVMDQTMNRLHHIHSTCVLTLASSESKPPRGDRKVMCSYALRPVSTT